MAVAGNGRASDERPHQLARRGSGADAPLRANDRGNQRDGFGPTDADRHSQQAHGTQLVGYFGIDRLGVVRWRYLEAERRPEDIGNLPTKADLMVAGRALTSRTA